MVPVAFECQQAATSTVNDCQSAAWTGLWTATGFLDTEKLSQWPVVTGCTVENRCLQHWEVHGGETLTRKNLDQRWRVSDATERVDRIGRQPTQNRFKKAQISEDISVPHYSLNCCIKYHSTTNSIWSNMLCCPRLSGILWFDCYSSIYIYRFVPPYSVIGGIPFGIDMYWNLLFEIDNWNCSETLYMNVNLCFCEV